MAGGQKQHRRRLNRQAELSLPPHNCGDRHEVAMNKVHVATVCGRQVITRPVSGGTPLTHGGELKFPGPNLKIGPEET